MPKNKPNIRTIGIIGGMSWESTVLYYQWINRGVRESLGGLHSAKLVLFSVDFEQIKTLQHAGDWQAAGEILNQAAHSLKLAGADFLLIATNTMHKVAEQTMEGVELPLLHIVDPTAEALCDVGCTTVGLLGTGFTMKDDFYKGKMHKDHAIEVIVPDEADQSVVHCIIYEELCQGQINADSRALYLDIIHKLQIRGAQAVILGCTEITLLVDQSQTQVPLFDTTAIHAQAAVSKALAK